MPPAYRPLIELLVILLFIGGCGNRKIEDLTAELEQSKKTIQTLEASNHQLLERYGRLQDDFTALQSEQENLKIKQAQLAEWAQQLAEQYGPSVWYIGIEEKPLPHKSIKDATAPILARELNHLFKRSNLPRFTVRKIDGNTAYVHVGDDRQLTQEMGTTGATAYIQAITYTFTSLSGINHVDFDFQAGDHAVPGKYSR